MTLVQLNPNPFDTGDVIECTTIRGSPINGPAALVIEVSDDRIRVAFADHVGGVKRCWFPWRDCRLVYRQRP